jgi:hypothetical protein
MKNGLTLRAQISSAAPATNKVAPAALSITLETDGAMSQVSGTAHHSAFSA